MSLGDVRQYRAVTAALLSAGLSVGATTGVGVAAPPAFVQSEGVGDQGPAVEAWQARLNEWLRLTGSDLYPIVVDGDFGPQTDTATRAFQRANAAVANDGTVDDDDRIALEASISTLQTTTPSAGETAEDETAGDEGTGDGSTDLGEGGLEPPTDADETMVWWQAGLNEWLRLAGSELYPIVVDGEFGAQTETATREFQSTYATLDVDGTVDPIDRVVLEDAVAALEAGAGLPASAESSDTADQPTGEGSVGEPTSGQGDEDADDGVDRLTTADDASETVAWWQARLNEWLDLMTSAMFPIVVDGWFGPQTEAATREFQSAEESLDVDGEVDQLDRVVLDQAIDDLEASDDTTSDDTATTGDTSDDPTSTDGNTVGPGDEGQLVQWWQAGLNEWLRLTGDDLHPIAVDGDFGPQTETATRIFQGATDGIDIDGSVSDDDRVALERAIAALGG